jgi:hypothetical protein
VRVDRAFLLCKARRSEPPRPPPVRPPPAVSRSPRELPPRPRPPARPATPAEAAPSESRAHAACAQLGPANPSGVRTAMVRRAALLPESIATGASPLQPIVHPAASPPPHRISATNYPLLLSHMPCSVGLSVRRPRAAAPATSTSGIWLINRVRPGSVSPYTSPHDARPVHLRRHRTWRARGVRTAGPTARAMTTATASAAGGLDRQLAALPNLQVPSVREPACPCPARHAYATRSSGSGSVRHFQYLGRDPVATPGVEKLHATQPRRGSGCQRVAGWGRTVTVSCCSARVRRLGGGRSGAAGGRLRGGGSWHGARERVLRAAGSHRHATSKSGCGTGPDPPGPASPTAAATLPVTKHGARKPRQLELSDSAQQLRVGTCNDVHSAVPKCTTPT